MNLTEIRKDIHEDEFDLFELLDIILRRKKIILCVSVIGILLTGFLTYTFGKNQHNMEGINFSLRSEIYKDFYFKKANIDLDKFTYGDMLYRDEIVNKLYNEIDENSTKSVEEKREILLKTIRVIPVVDKEKLEYLTLEVGYKGEISKEKKIINRYLDILNEELKDQVLEGISKKDYNTEITKKIVDERLELIQKKINYLSRGEEKNGNVIEILSFKYPKLIEDKRQLEDLYKKYSTELVGIKGLKKNKEINNLVYRISDIYTIKHSSKIKVIFLGGVIFSIFIGITLGFIEEFLVNYRNRKK